MEYRTLIREHVRCVEALNSLEIVINQYLADGWRPIGGISVAWNGLLYMVVQALVLDK